MSMFAVQPSPVGLKDAINHLVRWTVATPILATWFLASMLPMFGMFDANRTALTMFLDLMFFAVGFYPMLALFIGSRLVAVSLQAKEVMADSTRGMGLNLAGYAFVWLTLYSVYRALI
ncbi:MAG: hypothetical protein AAF742_00180 [Pseudomonadota bacterium]